MDAARCLTPPRQVNEARMSFCTCYNVRVLRSHNSYVGLLKPNPMSEAAFLPEGGRNQDSST
ncbi:hypothetical protein ACRRTK_018587 [Alexandromys fortis]